MPLFSGLYTCATNPVQSATFKRSDFRCDKARYSTPPLPPENRLYAVSVRSSLDKTMPHRPLTVLYGAFSFPSR